MRIIQVNKFNYIRGGAEKYFLDITAKLQAEGHEVAVFSMQHPKNFPSVWSKYFVSRISFNESAWRDRFIALGRMIYSFEARRKFSKLLDEFKPDLVHAHNIYNQLSPSILSAAHKRGIPVVMHLHDYALVSPNRLLFSRGKIYERCLGGHYGRCILDRCHKDSYLKSALASLTVWIHNSVLNIYRRTISIYIAPSAFMKAKAVEGALPEERIKVLRNFASTDFLTEPLSSGTRDYILYYGRLSEEKGLPVLFEAMAHIDPDLSLKVVGDGPLAAEYSAWVKKTGLTQRISFIPSTQGKELIDIIQGARAVIIPSIWYENMPLSLLEALALGKTVIASRIGGMPEVIQHGVNGFLFEAENSAELARLVNELDEEKIASVAKQARISQQENSLDSHYQQLMKIYDETLVS